MELISRIELETSPLPRECSTAELYEHVFNNYSKNNIVDLLKKYHDTVIINWLSWFIIDNFCDGVYMERVAGIEPASLAWKAKVLPLYHTRIYSYPKGL